MENKVYKELQNIQKQLVAKKDAYNKFGGFNYRTAEGILAEVKPLLKDCVVIIDESLELVGDRYYVVSKATLTDGETSISAIARAREDAELKGMNSGQISGATSSYAKKYALCNLFAIDGTDKDLDALDNEDTNTSKKASRIPQEEKDALKELNTTPTPKIVENKANNDDLKPNVEEINKDIELQAKYDSLIAQFNATTNGIPFIDLESETVKNYILKTASINSLKWLELNNQEKTRLTIVLDAMIQKKLATRKGK